jgi:mRNA-degrading endonuclease toxin of MazEF toxin-antitoxin module
MADQIATIRKQLLLRQIGSLSKKNLEAVARAVCIQLNL